ncbi:hypothetical protein M885DRAFT_137535 [Pelagophyceae sp. CCMP2097]|nr:hypothetical protein M885DRAFT_137535 [Pelagophyceae sp. CCMP2097]
MTSSTKSSSCSPRQRSRSAAWPTRARGAPRWKRSSRSSKRRPSWASATQPRSGLRWPPPRRTWRGSRRAPWWARTSSKNRSPPTAPPKPRSPPTTGARPRAEFSPADLAGRACPRRPFCQARCGDGPPRGLRRGGARRRSLAAAQREEDSHRGEEDPH